MKKRFLCGAASVLLFVLLTSCTVSEAQTSATPSAEPVPSVTPLSPSPEVSSAPAPDALEYETERVVREVNPDEGKAFDFIAETPHFGSDAVDSYFETKINKLYSGLVAEISDGVGDPDADMAYELTYEVSYNHAGIVSVIFEKYSYFGGAYPNISYECDTIDVENAARLTLTDVLGSDERSGLLELAAKQLDADGIVSPDSDKKLSEYVEEAFDDGAFALRDGQLELFFPSYAFGYRGATRVCVEYAALKSAGLLADWIFTAE